MMVSVLFRLRASGNLDEFTNLAAYVARGEARPAYKKSGDGSGAEKTCQVTVETTKTVTATFDYIPLKAPLVSSISHDDKKEGQIGVLEFKYYIETAGIYPSPGGGLSTSEQSYVGQTMLFAGNFAPRGWALADGRLLPNHKTYLWHHKPISIL